MSSSLTKEIQQLQKSVIAQSNKVDKIANSGRYLDADEENKKLEKMKQKLASLKLQALQEEQVQDRQTLDRSFAKQAGTFSQQWDQNLLSFETDIGQQLEEMKQRQDAEVEALTEELNNEPLPPLRPSIELRNLRNYEKQMSRQKKYVEAQQVKEKADNLEQRELLLQNDREQKRKIAMIQNLRIAHADERKVLEKQRERERARLLQERGKVAVNLQTKYKTAINQERSDADIEQIDLRFIESRRRTREAAHRPERGAAMEVSLRRQVGDQPVSTAARQESERKDKERTLVFNRTGTGSATTRSFGGPVSLSSTISSTRPRNFDPVLNYRSPSAPKRLSGTATFGSTGFSSTMGSTLGSSGSLTTRSYGSTRPMTTTTAGAYTTRSFGYGTKREDPSVFKSTYQVDFVPHQTRRRW